MSFSFTVMLNNRGFVGISKYNSIRFLFFVFIIELILGGGGSILNCGGVSLRMLIYVVCLVVFIFASFNRALPKVVYFYLIFWTGLLLLGALLGAIQHASGRLILLDIKPLLIFYVLPFFCVFFLHPSFRPKEITSIGRCIIFSSFAMALFYIPVYYGCHFNSKVFESTYSVLSHLGVREFIFKSKGSFFYKGFIYFGIGLIFSLNRSYLRKYNYLAGFVFFWAIFVCGLRGMLFSIVLVFIVDWSFFNQNNKVRWLAFFSYCFILVFGWSLWRDFLLKFMNFYGNTRDYFASDTLRLDTIFSVFSSVAFVSIILGHGFGVGVAVRSVHMEISFLEIFQKQGLLGLFFYAFLFVHIVRLYCKFPREIQYRFKPFVLGTLYFYMVSFTNPFVNNPIGMTFVILSLSTGFYLNRMTYV